MRFAVLGVLLLSVAAPAAPPPHTPAPHKPMPPGPVPHGPPLDELFAQLRKAQSPDEAKPVEDRIFSLFVQSGSPSIDLLMTRAAAAQATGDDETAKKLFDSVTGVAPDFAEGWHERAMLQVEAGDDEGAMLSLQKTVTLNPRQFAALSQLGDMLEEYGNKPGALKMYRRALALDPQLEGAAKHLHELEKDVEGQGI